MNDHRNPLREAFRARDIDRLRDALADDVVLRSPIFSVPFEGKDECAELFEALFETLGEMVYVLDEPGDPAVFAWRTEIDGEPLEGVDLVRLDDEGKIAEVTVFMRPLRGIAAFADAMGPHFAGNPAQRAFLKVAGAAPTMMMRAFAGLGPRLIGVGRKRS